LKKGIENIIFSDESYFCVFRNKKGTWAKEGQKPIIKKVNFKTAVMVWSAIGYDIKSDIIIKDFGFKINSGEYIKVLENNLLSLP